MTTTSSPLTSTPVPATPLAQIQRTPRPDALLESLLAVCKVHGLAATRDSLTAGLPADEHGMTLATAERAAQRAGLSTRLYKVDLASIDKATLPAIVLLRDRGACVLLGVDAGASTVILPQTGMAEVPMPLADLESRYAGVVLFARPKLDAKALAGNGTAKTPRAGHWFWSAVLAQRTVYRDVLWAAALVNLLAIALPMFTMNVYDRVVPNAAFETLWALAIGISIAIGAELMLRAIRGRFVDEASARVDVELSARLMQQVLDLRLEHRPPSVGVFASTLRGFESVRELIASGTVTALVDLPFGLLFLALVVWVSPWLSLPVIAAFALTVGLGAWLQQRLHHVSQQSWQAQAQRQAALVETIAGLETVKAQGAQGRVQARWERANEHLAGLTVRMRAQSTSAMLGAAWISQMTTVAIVVIGVHLIAERTLTMGALIAVSMLASRALAPASQIVGLLLQYQGARSALDALNKLMAAPVERAVPASGDADNAAGPSETDAVFAARGPLRGAITFDKVCFRYPGRDDAALHEASFTIAPGESVAFIGRAGSGKSTIQRLLMGLYQPTSGTVRFDGVDIRQFDPAGLRRDIASVGQDNLLFQGTLRDNIALAMPHADDADILAAAHAAGLGAFIDKHPKGLHLQVGERGEGLSGGQRQAVALARALLHGGTILCLDEPTSAMDQASEAQVSARLAAHQRAAVGAHGEGPPPGHSQGGPAPSAGERGGHGLTLILSTHRRSLLSLVTRVIVIDDGRIVADGPRERVLAAIEAPKLGTVIAAAQAGTVIAAAKAGAVVTSPQIATGVAPPRTGTVFTPPNVITAVAPPKVITAVAPPKVDPAAKPPKALPMAALVDEIPVFTRQKLLPEAAPTKKPEPLAPKARKAAAPKKRAAPKRAVVVVEALPASDTVPAGASESTRVVVGASVSDTKPPGVSDTKPPGASDTTPADTSATTTPAGVTNVPPADVADFADTVPAAYADLWPAAATDGPAAPPAQAAR